MGLSVYVPSPLIVIVATALAVVTCVVMFMRGHNYMMIPMAFSLGWIGFGYLLGQIGAQHDDTSAIIRSGIIILCANFIVGGIIWIRGKRYEHG
jgi:hypothetical protein